MAQSGSAMGFVCRSCRRQTRALLSQSRTFSGSVQQRKSIPTFTPTSNPELDELLLIFREKYFKPAALSQGHRDLIYKPKHQQLLINEPGVTVTLSDGEEIRLMPTDPYDKPKKDKALKRLRELLESSGDSVAWSNIPALLEGMKMAKQKCPDGWLQKIVRKANEHKQTGIIMKCAQMVKRTGFTLSDVAVTQELVLGLHNMAAEANWQGTGLERAATWAERLGLMMEDKLHCSGKLDENHRDMRTDLCVMGTLLELSASKALSVNSGEDVDGKVLAYAIRLLARWKQTPLESIGRPEQDLEMRIPLWNGVRMALKLNAVKKSNIGKELGSRLKGLEVDVSELSAKAEAQADGKPRRCLQMYNAVLGK